jgi:hypothetical protein
VVYILELGRWRSVTVHVPIRAIVHRLLGREADPVAVIVRMVRRIHGGLMGRILWGLVKVGLVLTVRLSEMRGRLTRVTIVSFTRRWELIEMCLRHTIVSILLRSWLMLGWRSHMSDRFSLHISVLLIGVVSIVHRPWSRSAHLRMRLSRSVVTKVAKLRTRLLWGILRIIVWMKVHVWVDIWP